MIADRITAQQLTTLLTSTGPLSVNDMARHLDVLPATLYGPLIAAEARGMVRINVDFRDDGRRARTWEAMVQS